MESNIDGTTTNILLRRCHQRDLRTNNLRRPIPHQAQPLPERSLPPTPLGPNLSLHLERLPPRPGRGAYHRPRPHRGTAPNGIRDEDHRDGGAIGELDVSIANDGVYV